MATSFQVSSDLLPPTGHIPTFATVGVGSMLARSLGADLLSDRSGFPFLTRGRALLLVADFGGHHQKQDYDTYTFLILDLAKNQEWLAWQHHFRPATTARTCSLVCALDQVRVEFSTVETGFIALWGRKCASRD